MNFENIQFFLHSSHFEFLTNQHLANGSNFSQSQLTFAHTASRPDPAARALTGAADRVASGTVIAAAEQLTVRTVATGLAG